jgi:SAM-dependent methyltransferase
MTNTENTTNESCCTVKCDIPLNQEYWDAQYKANATGWDLGQASPPLMSYINIIGDKNLRILIPGAGNAYEADYLLNKGFNHITIIDIAPTVVDVLKKKYAGNPNIQIILGDFFELAETYDLIIEQTFFCALPPYLRQSYVWKMHQLLSPQGKLAGLLFNRTFEKSPPFGGSLEEYQLLFKDAFLFEQLQPCANSIEPRQGSELFVEFAKNNQVTVQLYTFQGMHCSSCKEKITGLYQSIPGVKNVSFSSDYQHVIIVSEFPIELSLLQSTVSYDAAYHIAPVM